MNPFFIVGSPRSGTTILRNYLKKRTRLICPEETFYYRWTFPFGSTEYLNRVNSNLQKKHRQIDQINESEFQSLLENCQNRRELLLGHIKLMGGKDDLNWFEKTPQHIYSIPLILSDFPNASILFVVRNPLDSIASIYSGKTLIPGSLKAAIAYWNEAYSLYRFYKKILKNIFIIRYEDFAFNPEIIFKNFVYKIDPDIFLKSLDNSNLVKVPNIGSHLKILNSDQIKIICDSCEEGIKFFKYN